MIVTSIAFDYFKGYVTAFIDITGSGETIFAKPKVQPIRKIVNVVSIIEQICSCIFLLLLMIRIGTSARGMLWGVVVPVELFFAFTGIASLALFGYFVYASFRYTTELYWLIAYFFFFPIIFINLLLFFGVPILVSIIMPIQIETDVWYQRRVRDFSAYLILWLVGGLMKGFVKGSDDSENPYSKEHPNVILRFVYFLFFFLVAVFIFIVTGRIDQKIPFSQTSFPAISYWIVFVPLFVALVMAFCVFAFRAAITWHLLVKGDENKDGPLFPVTYTYICIYLVLNLITCILFCVRGGLSSTKQAGFSGALCLIPTMIGQIGLLIVSILPFIPSFKKRTNPIEEEVAQYEVLTFL